MTMRTQDQWAQWLLRTRHGGDPEVLKAMMQPLFQIRDSVLQHAGIAQGETVLDIGSGDGLIAFGALPLVAERGKVIFSDISQDLLLHCQTLARQMGVSNQCQFVQAAADNLEAIGTGSVDVITVRSVLIYVRDKLKAFQEFYRVLKPQGRLSLFEPLPSLMHNEPPHLFFGYDATPIMSITQKLRAAYERPFASLLGFNEHELLRAAEQAGFPELYVDVQMAVIPNIGQRLPAQRMSWAAFLKSSLNPLASTLEEAMRSTLTQDEIARFAAHMRPLVEANQRIERSAVVYLWTIKR
jgi:arsenite methyltransferase